MTAAELAPSHSASMIAVVPTPLLEVRGVRLQYKTRSQSPYPIA
jgi:hypothetical protein